MFFFRTRIVFTLPDILASTQTSFNLFLFLSILKTKDTWRISKHWNWTANKHIINPRYGYCSEVKVGSRQISMRETFSSLSRGSSSLRLLHYGNLKLSEVVNSICIKRFRNKSFTSNFYFSGISGKPVDIFVWDTGNEPFIVNCETILKLEKNPTFFLIWD